MKRQFLSFPTSTPRGLSLQLRDDVEVHARDLLRAAEHVRDLRAHEQLRLALRASGGLSFVITNVDGYVHFLPTFSRFFHIFFSRISQHFRVASIWRTACPPCFSFTVFLDIFQHGYPQRFAQNT